MTKSEIIKGYMSRQMLSLDLLYHSPKRMLKQINIFFSFHHNYFNVGICNLTVSSHNFYTRLDLYVVILSHLWI